MHDQGVVVRCPRWDDERGHRVNRSRRSLSGARRSPSPSPTVRAASGRRTGWRRASSDGPVTFRKCTPAFPQFRICPGTTGLFEVDLVRSCAAIPQFRRWGTSGTGTRPSHTLRNAANGPNHATVGRADNTIFAPGAARPCAMGMGGRHHLRAWCDAVVGTDGGPPEPIAGRDRARGWSADSSPMRPPLAEAIVCRLCYNSRTRESVCAGRKPALRLGRVKRNHHVRQDQGCAQRRQRR
jgi:hypothetical protein